MRKVSVLVLVLLLSVLWLRPRRSESVAPSFVFPISVSGKAFTTDLAFGPGIKVKPGKVNDKAIAAILLGQNTSDLSVPFIDILHADPSGRFFIYLGQRNATDGSTSWRVATNPTGVMTTTLHGSITRDGFFWLTGTYSVPAMGSLANAFAQGRVKFAKDMFEPTKVTGVLNFTSAVIGQSFTLKFKTVGKPTVAL